jgi:pimeloyl-ACP methyl ester carboxylesterase
MGDDWRNNHRLGATPCQVDALARLCPASCARQESRAQLSDQVIYPNTKVTCRTLIPRINLPALIISGRASFIPWKSQEWIHRQIKGSQFEVFEEPEGGQILYSSKIPRSLIGWSWSI